MMHFLNTLRVIFYCTLVASSLLVAKSHQESYDWYLSFYQSLAQQKINKIRYFQIWVAPGKESAAETLPIGGSKENFELWRQTIEEFIENLSSQF